MNRADMIQALAAHQAAARALRAALEDAAREELTRAGTAPTWKTSDGSRVSVGLTQARVVVTNEEAFIDWARVKFPEELIERTVVEFRNRAVRDMILVEWGQQANELPPFLARVEGGEFHSLTFTPAPDTRRRLAETAEAYAAGITPTMPILEA